MSEYELRNSGIPLQTIEPYSLHDARRMIDAIGSFVQSTDQTVNTSLIELAHQYADCSRYTNERLTRCHELLRRGSHSQAIQQAEETPDLIQLCEVLQFKQLSQWQDLVAGSGLQRFEPLNSDCIEMLRVAMEDRATTADLLRRHRVLAVAHAPLSARIDVLRQLVASGIENAGWQRDLRDYETTYARELIQQATSAQANGDTTTFRLLIAKLDGEPWADGDVPETVRSRVAPLLIQCHQELTLPAITFALRTAISQNDATSTQRTLDAYNTTASRLRSLSPNWIDAPAHQAILQQAQTLLLRKDQAHKRAEFLKDLQQLRQAIANSEEEATVGYYYQQAVSHGIEIPSQVRAEIENYKYDAAETKVLNSGILIAVLAALVFLIALLFFVLMEISNNNTSPEESSAPVTMRSHPSASSVTQWRCW